MDTPGCRNGPDKGREPQGSWVSSKGTWRVGCSPHRSASRRPRATSNRATSNPHDAQCSGHGSAPLSLPTTWLRPSPYAPSALLPAQPRLCSLSSTPSSGHPNAGLAAAWLAGHSQARPLSACAFLGDLPSSLVFKTISEMMTQLSFPWTPDFCLETSLFSMSARGRLRILNLPPIQTAAHHPCSFVLPAHLMAAPACQALRLRASDSPWPPSSSHTSILPSADLLALPSKYVPNLTTSHHPSPTTTWSRPASAPIGTIKITP
uniref:Uncharacterized protein n=1 Tax=Myotis myotis TaxID=51298 RepID=A0A7J7ZX26_MYOMY|nr:hypothetical protein mMyoMyo1_009599 [Myotis myotis]